MTSTSDIIQNFELYTGGSLTLSPTEELELCQKHYNELLSEHDWEILKKTASGTLSTSVDYISAATDLDHLTSKKTIYVGTTYRPYLVVPFADKRMYTNSDGYAYYDARLGRFVFTKQPTSAEAYEYDYIYIPPALDISTSNPVFPTRFYPAIYHGMLMDNDIIEMSEKARAYSVENAGRRRKIINDMLMWNSQIAGYDTVGA